MKCFSAAMCTCYKYHGDLSVISETWFRTQREAGKWIFATTWNLFFIMQESPAFSSSGRRNGFAFPSSWVLPPSALLGSLKQCVPGSATQRSFLVFRPTSFFVLRLRGWEVEEHLGWTQAVSVWSGSLGLQVGTVLLSLAVAGLPKVQARSTASLSWIYPVTENKEKRTVTQWLWLHILVNSVYLWQAVWINHSSILVEAACNRTAGLFHLSVFSH